MSIESLEGEIALIANAPVRRDRSDIVDRTDLVIRFNACGSFDCGTGTKTDWVSLNNVAQPALAMLQHGLPECAKGTNVLITRPVETHYDYYDKCQLYEWPKALVCAERAFLHHFAIERCARLRPEQYGRVFERLIALDGKADFVMPSAGFTVLECLSQTRSCSRVTLVGFTFEGWPGHPWVKERAIAEQYADEGWVRFLD